MSDGATSSVDGVTIVTDNTGISASDGTIEIQFNATCENKGSYYCTATGSDSPPETLAYVTIIRQPKVESLSLSISWIENRYQFAEHPTYCVAEVGYPPGTVYLESNLGGKFQQLALKTPTNDAEQNCGNVVTLTYAHPDLIDSTWEGAIITCRVAGGDDHPDVEVSDVVHVLTDTFCDNEQPGESNKLEHPYACSAWLTCNRDDGTLDTCTTEVPCYAVPYPICKLTQCYDWSSKECYTLSTTTSTTTTTTTTTTPAPGTPFITCTTNLNTVYDGDSAQFQCTIRDIAIMSMLKITNQNGIELYNEADDQGISGTLTDGVSQVTINGENTLLTITLNNVNCEQVGVYTIHINNVTSDYITLHILAYEMIPTLTLPSEIIANSLTEITCIGKVGLNAEGTTFAKLSFEVQFPDDTAFNIYSDGVNKTLEDENCNPTETLVLTFIRDSDFQAFSDDVTTMLEDENCNPIETLVLTFYPDATWNSASIRCVSTNIDSGDRTMSTDSTIVLQTAGSTVSTATSTTTTTTTTTTTAPGSPYIQCSDVVSPTGANENIDCTLNNIARVVGDTIKVMKGDSEMILDTQTATGTVQDNGISYDVAPSLNIVIEDTTVQLQFGPLLCEQSGTYTVQYLSDSEADPVQGFGDLTITADANTPNILTSPAEFYRGQEIAIMCIGNLGSPEDTTEITLKLKSSADQTYQPVAITSSTVFNEDVCANDKTISHRLYVTDTIESSQYMCVTTTNDGSSLTSQALTVAIAEPVIYISYSPTSPEIGNAYTIRCVVSTTDVTITAITVSKGQNILSSWSSDSAEITDNTAGIAGAITLTASETTFSVTFASIVCEDDGEYFCDATHGDEATSVLKTRTFFNATQTPLLKLPSTLVAGEATAYSDTLDCTATTEQGGSLKLQIYSSGSSSYEDFAIGTSITPDPVACSVENISFRQITFDKTYDNVNVRCATFDSSNNVISDDTQAIRLIEPPANCTSDADAFYKHPFDCYKYLRCTGGRMYANGCADTSQCPAIYTVDNQFASCSTSNCENCRNGK